MKTKQEMKEIYFGMFKAGSRKEPEIEYFRHMARYKSNDDLNMLLWAEMYYELALCKYAWEAMKKEHELNGNE